MKHAKDQTMKPSSIVLLEFDPQLDDLGKGKKLRDGLSVALQIGDTLWVANDESVTLERLSLIKEEHSGQYMYGRDHKQFALHELIQLPSPPEEDSAEMQEIDIEGLAYENGYLWLVGSHSLKRKNPSRKKVGEQAHKQLAKIEFETNRYLLARIPVVEENGTVTLVRETSNNAGKQAAARLRTHDTGNILSDALKDDAHLAPFLYIPGKDNGFDIEGLAVSGRRVFLGLRGPVLRGWAVILEVEVAVDKADSSFLKLKRVHADGRRYRKHFLDLGGLGIRDLCVEGTDLLILAGPTMDLDGPVIVYRWKNGTHPEDEFLVRTEELTREMEIPFGEGDDHAEGMCLYAPDGDNPSALLVVYDSAATSRHLGRNTMIADVFTLSHKTRPI
jgi:hypothetical protein